jgi:preprotein translocase subunit Sec63
MRLISNKIKIIPHDNEPKCPALKSINTENIEKKLTKKEISSIKKIFKQIEKETKDYKKIKSVIQSLIK